MSTLTVTVNDEARTLDPGATVRDLVTTLGLPDEGVAVAVDGAVVPASAWPTTALADGATVDVLTAVQGG